MIVLWKDRIIHVFPITVETGGSFPVEGFGRYPCCSELCPLKAIADTKAKAEIVGKPGVDIRSPSKPDKRIIELRRA